MMKLLKTKVSITLDDNIIKEIKDLAEKDDRSFSQYINKILKDWLVNNTHAKNSDILDQRYSFVKKDCP